MVGFSLKLKNFKDAFFDRQAVVSAIDKVSIRVLSRFGAFVRRSAKGRIRRRKKPSLPGQSPSSHSGLLRDNIYFAMDLGNRSVVIGPAKLGGGTDAPHVLEYGGDTVISGGRSRGKRIHIEARPYMQPAFEENLSKLPDIWREAVIR